MSERVQDDHALFDQPGGAEIDISEWPAEEGFGVFPQGAKPKRMLRCPARAAPYLISGHAYLFKKAEGFRSLQMWSEAIAYRIGAKAGLDVPRCFIAVDRHRNEAGALVEFFYGFPGEKAPARLTHAVDIVLRSSNRGAERPHGVRTNVRLCRALGIVDAVPWWARVLAFDALIGNTDRHLQNWGYLSQAGKIVSMAPVFDNGTSLAYEYPEQRLADFDARRLKAYALRGTHHCGWDLREDYRTPHFKLCERFFRAFPDAVPEVQNLIQLDRNQIASILNWATEFEISVPFTARRADFISSLIETRRQLLVQALEHAR